MSKLNQISEIDRYLFGEGTHYQIYDKLGAHPVNIENEQGVYFAVWAPHAKAVTLIGDFNGWDGSATPMTPIEDSGIYEVFVSNLEEGALYKFQIQTASGTFLPKADPYAFWAECRPGTASKVCDLSQFTWSDEKWMLKRKKNKFADCSHGCL